MCGRSNSDATAQMPGVQSRLLSRGGAAAVFPVIGRTVLIDLLLMLLPSPFPSMLWLTTAVVPSVRSLMIRPTCVASNI